MSYCKIEALLQRLLPAHGSRLLLLPHAEEAATMPHDRPGRRPRSRHCSAAVPAATATGPLAGGLTSNTSFSPSKRLFTKDALIDADVATVVAALARKQQLNHNCHGTRNAIRHVDSINHNETTRIRMLIEPTLPNPVESCVTINNYRNDDGDNATEAG